MLAVRHVKKAYAQGGVVDASIDLRRGEIVGLVGPGGSGKTTLFEMIAGSLRPDAGKIMLDGYDVTMLPMFERARRGIGYLVQDPSLFRGLTVGQNILMALETLPLDRAARKVTLDGLLRRFRLAHLRNQIGSKLSGGERRRAEIVRAIASRPNLLLLDEPFAGVDPIAVQELHSVIKAIRDNGVGVLITDHNVREILSLGSRIYVIENGRVVHHAAPDRIASHPYLRRTFLGEGFKA